MRRRQSAAIRRNMIILAIIIVVAGLCVWGFNRAKAPEKQARQEATAMAKKYANIKTVKQFYWYNRNQSYYTIVGVNQKNQNVYVIIPQKGDSVNIYGINRGISAKRARQIVTAKYQVKSITHVALGMRKKQPVWEVTFFNNKGKVSYVQIAFKTGKIVNQVLSL